MPPHPLLAAGARLPEGEARDRLPGEGRPDLPGGGLLHRAAARLQRGADEALVGSPRDVVPAKLLVAQAQSVRFAEARQRQRKGEKAIPLLPQPGGHLPALLDLRIGMGQKLHDGSAVPAGLRLPDQILGEGTVPVFRRQADGEFESIGVDIGEARQPLAQALGRKRVQGPAARREAIGDDAQKVEGGLAGGAVPIQRAPGRRLGRGCRAHLRHDPRAIGRRLDGAFREPLALRLVEALPEGRGGLGIASAIGLLVQLRQQVDRRQPLLLGRCRSRRLDGRVGRAQERQEAVHARLGARRAFERERLAFALGSALVGQPAAP